MFTLTKYNKQEFVVGNFIFNRKVGKKEMDSIVERIDSKSKGTPFYGAELDKLKLTLRIMRKYPNMAFPIIAPNDFSLTLIREFLKECMTEAK